MRSVLVLCVVFCGFVFSDRQAAAAVNIEVNLSSQTMHVSNRGEDYIWAVSTARPGYATPRGVFHPISLQPMHYSRKYNMSPMPHSIFFRGGYAIHGTYETAGLGRPVSHGCVRLSPAHAAQLYQMVKAEGARITIVGSPPQSRFIARVPTHRVYAETSRARALPSPTYAPANSYDFGFYRDRDASPW